MKTIFLAIYKSMVRSHLEYANCIWSPLTAQDKKNVEKVQMITTKLIQEIKHLSYIDSLDLYLYWITIRINHASFVSSSHTHFAIIHRHIIHANFYVIWLVSVYDYVVINLFNFFRHYKSHPFHTVIRIHLILLSYHILVILPSHFSSMEQMLMLLTVAPTSAC